MTGGFCTWVPNAVLRGQFARRKRSYIYPRYPSFQDDAIACVGLGQREAGRVSALALCERPAKLGNSGQWAWKAIIIPESLSVSRSKFLVYIQSN